MLLLIFSLALSTFQEVGGRAAFAPPITTIFAASAMGRGRLSSVPRIDNPLVYDASIMKDQEVEALQTVASASGKAAVRTIFILSDETCVTAKSAIEKMLDFQFNEVDERFVHVDNNGDGDENGGEDRCERARMDVQPFIRTEEQVGSILRKAEEIQGMVVFTFSDPDLRAKTSKMCELSQLTYVDLAGPLFDGMSRYFHRKPHGSPREEPPHLSKWALSDSYYKRVEAIEYTLKCDDGESTSSLPEADVILVGVSRTGKTPLSVVLSQTMGLKVANIPLVVDEELPRQLIAPGIDRNRVFCLTLDPDDLQRIRKTRMKRALAALGPDYGSHESTYDDMRYIYRDLENARYIAKKHGFTVIDVTGRAVEESASLIISMLYERFPSSNNNKHPIVGG